MSLFFVLFLTQFGRPRFPNSFCFHQLPPIFISKLHKGKDTKARYTSVQRNIFSSPVGIYSFGFRKDKAVYFSYESISHLERTQSNQSTRVLNILVFCAEGVISFLQNPESLCLVGDLILLFNEIYHTL